MNTELFKQLLEREFGGTFEDLRSTLPRHTGMKPGRFNVATARGIAVHHTAAESTWQAVAQYHVWGVDPKRGKTEWPTIAYAVGIKAGRVSLLRNLEELGNHVYGRNEELLSAVVMGDLTKREPAQVDISALARVILLYDKLLGRKLPVQGHGYWALAGHNTTCPGPTLARMAPGLRAMETLLMDAAPAVNYAKVVYFIEAAARQADAEGLHNEHDYIVAEVLPSLIRLRG